MPCPPALPLERTQLLGSLAAWGEKLGRFKAVQANPLNKPCSELCPRPLFSPKRGCGRGGRSRRVLRHRSSPQGMAVLLHREPSLSQPGGNRDFKANHTSLWRFRLALYYL